MAGLTKKQQKRRNRVVVALVIFLVLEMAKIGFNVFEGIPGGIWVEFVAFLVPYLIAGYDVLLRAWRGIVKGQPFDENLLMTIATLGAFALVLFPNAEPHMAEGAAVMLFYQVGELFEDYAVGRTRRSIADMMDIAPEYATVERDGESVQVAPELVVVGSEILVKPGERIPLDGVVISGSSQLDTSALTGESMPRSVKEGETVISGCVNMTSVLRIRTTRPYGESTVQRILDLVENASERKAQTENFITRFARYYTPAVVGLAVAIALVCPLLLGMSWLDSIQGALVFLVVSCPCALVISVPLSFFGGIGAASQLGIMVKGSSYLEVLGRVDTMAFDKTGTLTNGSFEVVEVDPQPAFDSARLLYFAAHAEAFSNHPIAQSVRESYGKAIDESKVSHVEELAGQGISAVVQDRQVLVGNAKLMRAFDVVFEPVSMVGTVLYVAIDKDFAGFIAIADAIKQDAAPCMEALHAEGVRKLVMLTGDRQEVASAVAKKLGIDAVRAELLPHEKVTCIEELIAEDDSKGAVAYVGDGINDAPVLMRADVGIAMGGMGSDAAIEAADIVLMDDKPSNIVNAIRIARKTMRIVWQNIIFALGVKIGIMILALPGIGIANMWIAVFGDVGVACLAILNAMRCLTLGRKPFKA